MTHTLRKYLSNRGSALFMVLSTMTALLIAVMAMYFSVVSSRTVQYAVFNQEQSYQSALSLQNAMTSNLTPSGPMGALLTKITQDSFKEGDSISTNGNDFLAFGGTNEEQDNVGAYDVTVTRLKNEKVNGVDCLTYDFATTVSVNGVQDTTHVIIHVQLAEDENYPASSELFAATGYVPNNAYISGGWYVTKSSYDNEITYVNALTGGDSQFADLACGGSLEVDGKLMSLNSDKGGKKPYTWVVRGDMYINGAFEAQFGDATAGQGKIYVGGDLYVNDTGLTWSYTDIYVIGNAYFAGGNLNNSTNKLYVHGNLTIDGNQKPNFVYCNGTAKKEGTVITTDAWDTSDVDEVIKLINAKTASHEFQKWVVKPDNFNGCKQYIAFNSTGADVTDTNTGNTIPAKTYVWELPWTAAGKEQYADIIDIYDFGSGEQCYTIIFDTGDDPNNILYLRLNGNIDYDEDGTNEFFRWVPDNNGKQVSILYKGQGSIVATLEDDVRYASSRKEILCHKSIFDVMGGSISYSGASEPSVSLLVSEMRKFIHTECEGCTSCIYTVEDSTKTCSTCGKKMKTIICENHSYYNTCCVEATCDVGKLSPQPDEWGKYHDLCVNRIDKAAFTTYAASKGKAGLEIPNVNFFLVSCDESAEMYFSPFMYKDDGGDMVLESFSENHFFGFIYAPYMTYKGMKAGGGAGLAMCGGMVVSDYILNDSVYYMNCYPTFMPEQLGATAGKLAHADKSWKATVSRN